MRRAWWLVLGVSVVANAARAQPPVCSEVTWPNRMGVSEDTACAPHGTIEAICARLEARHRQDYEAGFHDCEVVATLTPDLVLIRSSSIEGGLYLAAGPPDDRALIAILEGWSALGGNHPEYAGYVRYDHHRVGGRSIIGIETRFEHSDDYADVQQSYAFHHTTFCELRGPRSRDTRCLLQLTTSSTSAGREWAPAIDGNEYGAWARRTVTRSWRRAARATASVRRDGTIRLQLRRGTWAGLFQEGDPHMPSDESQRTVTYPLLPARSPTP